VSLNKRREGGKEKERDSVCERERQRERKRMTGEKQANDRSAEIESE